MRRTAIVGLLCLAAACGDEPVEVREAESEAPTEAAAAPEADAPETTGEVEEAEVGVVVEMLVPGEGKQALVGSTVRVHYEAWLAEVHGEGGKPFDSSVARLIPLELELGGGDGPGVIEGLDRGLLGMRVGSRALLRVPAELGWGSEGHEAAGVPPDSDLVYEVRLVSVR